jgi:hypothetical protein
MPQPPDVTKLKLGKHESKILEEAIIQLSARSARKDTVLGVTTNESIEPVQSLQS